MHGDLTAARVGHLARITADPDDLGAWVGLGLAIRGAARAVLLDRPELVRAVHLGIEAAGKASNPVGLAGWIGVMTAGLPA